MMIRMNWCLLLAVASGFVMALALGACTPADHAYSRSDEVAQIEEPMAAGSFLQECPPAASIPVTVQRQFHVTLLRPNSRPRTLLTGATWSLSDATAASVDSSGLVTALSPGTVTVTAAYQGLTATSTLTVTSAMLVSVDVDPPARNIQIGTHASFRAMGTFSDGRAFPLTGAVTWGSTNSTVATVDANGRASGVAAGISAIQATDTATGLSAKGFLTVGTASLKSLAISPPAPSTTPGSSVPFLVTGTFSDSSTQDLTDTATWSSATLSVATISNASGSPGVATAVAAGTTTIKAVVARKTATAQLTVTSASLVSIAVSPATANIPNGLSTQLVATGTYSDHTTQNITAQVTWSSSSSAVFLSNGTNSSGLATALAPGTATVTATDVSGISGTATVTVTAAVLEALSVTPPAATVPVGLTQQYAAIGTFTDSTTRDMTSGVTWSSTSPSIAAVSSTGLASALTVGATTVSALDARSGITASVSLTVSPAVLESLAITPASASIANGLTEQLAATGTFSDGSHTDLTSTVSWSVPNGTAVVSSAGLVTSNGVGANTIEAAMGSVTATATVTVTAAALVSIRVIPASPSIGPNTTEALTATGTYSDGSTQNLTAIVTWSSSGSVATVSNAAGSNGVATSHAAGTAVITATDPATLVSGSTTLTVTGASLVSITVEPATASIALGGSIQFVALGTFSDGTQQLATTTATWSSSSPSAVISNAAGAKGLATGVAAGVATVTATDPATQIQGTATLTTAALVSLRLTPHAPGIAVGQTGVITATGSYTDGSSRNIASSVTWTSSSPAVVSVSNAGVIAGLALGSATVAATDPLTTDASSVSVTVSTTSPLASATIGATGGTLTSADGALLLGVPAGAVGADTVFSVQQVAPPGPGTVGPVYDLEPSGVMFNPPLTLLFDYAGANLEGVDPQGLSLASYDSPGAWDPVPSSVNVASQTIGAQVSHFTPWGFYPPAPSAFIPQTISFQIATGVYGLEMGDSVFADLYAADGSMMTELTLHNAGDPPWPGGPQSPVPYVYTTPPPGFPVTLTSPIAFIAIDYVSANLDGQWDMLGLYATGADASGNSPFCLIDKNAPCTPGVYGCMGDPAVEGFSVSLTAGTVTLPAGAGCALLQGITVSPPNTCLPNDPNASLQFTAVAGYGPYGGRVAHPTQDITFQPYTVWSLENYPPTALSTTGLFVPNGPGTPIVVATVPAPITNIISLPAHPSTIAGQSTLSVDSCAAGSLCCFDPTQSQAPTCQNQCSGSALATCRSGTTCDSGSCARCDTGVCGSGDMVSLPVGSVCTNCTSGPSISSSLANLNVCPPCPSGEVQCPADTCANLQTDRSNCGSCGLVCMTSDPNASGATCTGGFCVPTCNAGFSSCGGVCVVSGTCPSGSGNPSTSCVAVSPTGTNPFNSTCGCDGRGVYFGCQGADTPTAYDSSFSTSEGWTGANGQATSTPVTTCEGHTYAAAYCLAATYNGAGTPAGSQCFFSDECAGPTFGVTGTCTSGCTGLETLPTVCHPGVCATCSPSACLANSDCCSGACNLSTRMCN